LASARHVIVAGAGIAGLTAALALARAGLRTTVFEQAAKLEETGAGIQLSPNATRVLIADAISDQGVKVLRDTPGFEVTVETGMSPRELGETIGEYDGLVVRSATKVTKDVLASPGRLRVIGRAGTGVDNIDLDAATRANLGALGIEASAARTGETTG